MLTAGLLFLLVASAWAGRFGARPPTSSPSRAESDGKKRILMLISDTGGGHRASANALGAMMEDLRPEGTTDVKIVDIWTEHGAWPYNKMAAGYPFVCKHSYIWRAMYYVSPLFEIPWALETRLRCGARFRQCISEYEPDLVVSLHPLCQHLPMTVMRSLGWRSMGWRSKRTGQNKVPFATVVTDLGGAHKSWFVKGVDSLFVPSDAVRRIATGRGVADSKIRQYGLPVRRAFWTMNDGSKKPPDTQANALGMQPGKKTVLVIGGGDGVGKLDKIVEETAKTLSLECPDQAQVVAICGRNRAVKQRLEASKEQWAGVHVEVRGFTAQISEYMEMADCLVTKAGPGTIAEAAIRGLPTMLSSFLPGQEAGNVPFVIHSGFGEFSKKPKVIAERVSTWLQDDETRAQMSASARAVATPQATKQIAEDLIQMMGEVPPSDAAGD